MCPICAPAYANIFMEKFEKLQFISSLEIFEHFIL